MACESTSVVIFTNAARVDACWLRNKYFPPELLHVVTHVAFNAQEMEHF
jgi:hypothetical protein